MNNKPDQIIIVRTDEGGTINGIQATYDTPEIRDEIEGYLQTNERFTLPAKYTFEIRPSNFWGEVAKVVCRKVLTVEDVPLMERVEKYVAKMDPEYQETNRALAAIEEKIGWKGLFYLVQGYQRCIHPDNPYRFDNPRVIRQKP